MLNHEAHDSTKVLESKKEGKDQESIQSSTTPDPGYQWEVTTSQLDITNESQVVSPFPAGDHKARLVNLISKDTHLVFSIYRADLNMDYV